MKRIMVMGAAIEQLPGIIKAKEMGYEVGVIDFNPSAIGISYADKYYNVSTIDPEGVLKAARDFKTDGFLTLATDLPIRAVAYASKKLGLPGVSQETALKATDKGEMIKTLKEENVPSPWFFVIDDENCLKSIKNRITYPCIMKPVDNAASRGVVLIKSEKELIASYAYSRDFSHSGSVIIEEYLQGQEVSVEVLTYMNSPAVLAVTDKLTSGPPSFVEIGHNQYSFLSATNVERIKEVAIKAVSAIGIDNGPSHVEIMLTKNGPKIIELGARLGGDCITSHLVQLSTGIDMVKETITTLCGGKPNVIPLYKKGAAIRFLTSKEKGNLIRIDGIEKAKRMPGIVEISMISNIGDKISGTLNSSDDRLAYVIAQNESPEMAVEDAENALRILKVVLR